MTPDASDSPYLPPTSETRPGAGVRGTPSSDPPRGVSGSSETAPGSRAKPSLRDRLLGPKKEKPSDPRPAPPTREKTPSRGGRPGKRESAAETLGDIWSGFGGLAKSAGHVPTGRCLQWQAPIAGEMLDEAVAGSVVDKVALQRIVKGRQRFDLLGAVLGPPLLVMAIERNPANAETLMPMLRSSIRHGLPLMVPAIKKVQAREAKIAEATELLFADLPGYEPGTDPVDVVLSMMFEGWVPPTPPAGTSAGRDGEASSTEPAAPAPQPVSDVFDPGMSTPGAVA